MPAGTERFDPDSHRSPNSQEPVQESIPNAQALQLARSILQKEAGALLDLADGLESGFCHALTAIGGCRGNVLVVGIGKAGLIGQKISATLASTGTPSHFLHPAEAFHGDLGRVQPNDVIVILSFSGETEEITRLIPFLAASGCTLIAITSRSTSTLGQAADCVIRLGALREADPLELAPTTSTTAMLAVGDALALIVAKQRKFQPEDFARFHPGGNLGRKLARVEQAMRTLDQCRVANCKQSVREVLVAVCQPGRRTGAIMLVNEEGQLAGIFTDSDLARLIEERRESALDGPISNVMCDCPTSVVLGTMLTEAIEMLAHHKISELPVVDLASRPVGLIDITDVVTTKDSQSG